MKQLATLSLVLGIACVAMGQARLELRALMTGSTPAKGKAVWKVREPQAELQIEAENLRPNTAYVVKAGSATYTATSTVLGRIAISQRFIGLNRPTIAAGAPASVSTAAGVVVISGVFR